MKDKLSDNSPQTERETEGIETDREDCQSDDQSSIRDRFLIALPTLAGDYFASTVTYILEHNSKGAFGLVINKPLQLSLSDLFDKANFSGLQSSHIPVLDGGPVRRESIFFLHEAGPEYRFTQKISTQISLTTSEDLIHSLAHGEGPSKIIAVMGYAGWDMGQLERELAENVWLVAPATAEIIFDTAYQDRAVKAAALLGIDLNLVASNAGHG